MPSPALAFVTLTVPILPLSSGAMAAISASVVGCSSSGNASVLNTAISGSYDIANTPGASTASSAG